MASRKPTPQNDENDGWVTVAEESPTRVIFDTIGDQFTGTYIGIETVDPDNGKDDPFDMFLFRGTDSGLYAINKSYKLAQAMGKVDEGSQVRITYIKDIDTGRNLNPMKDFRVDVRA